MSDKKTITVAIIGAPNVGKSSLLNTLLGRKNSIVSPKPHTTRAQILGVHNVDNTQIVFLDTPGYMRKGQSIWSDCFISSVSDALDNSDVSLLLLDATQYSNKAGEALLKHLANQENLIVCINKIDLVARGKLYEIIEYITGFGYQDKVYAISSVTNAGVKDLVDDLVSRANPGDWMFEEKEDELAPYVRAAECVREKAFYCLNQEIPFFLRTRTTKWTFHRKPHPVSLQEIFNKPIWRMDVDIIVGQASHKSIVIGAKGTMIKRIGIAARTELESIWGPGQLFLNVVVDAHWDRDVQKIEEACYVTTIRNTLL